MIDSGENHADPDCPAAEQAHFLNKWVNWRGHRQQWLNKNNQNYLLNLFTVLLAASALVIMLVVGTAIYWIYSSAMITNAENSASSVVKAIMSAEVDNLLQDAPDGRLMLATSEQDMPRLDRQMHRYLKFFSLDQIKLFTPDKKIIYSTVPGIIGETVHGDRGLDRALNGREISSELQKTKDFIARDGIRIHDAMIVEAYAPVFDAGHRLLGIFEIYVDITPTRAAIFDVLLLTMSALGAVLAICLSSLYLPMKRGTLRLITAHRELEELATRDHLTGAYNRRYITDRVQQEFHRMQRQNRIDLMKESIGFIMADVDHFKHVNDTHGHVAGDEVLREVAARLKQGLRDFDVLCRYGGEEFLIMLPHSDKHDAMMVAERLRQSIIERPVVVDGIGPVPITVSFGVAFSTDDSESGPALIKRADRALYQAKEGGRNRVILADQAVA